mmetsp:Transcript_40293/g.64558  ORF Transcript_40293/g.64558 Transcript_40293/m.64558 type:complete len:202 (+) Transcript_40293:215-820(+)
MRGISFPPLRLWSVHKSNPGHMRRISGKRRQRHQIVLTRIRLLLFLFLFCGLFLLDHLRLLAAPKVHFLRLHVANQRIHAALLELQSDIGTKQRIPLLDQLDVHFIVLLGFHQMTKQFLAIFVGHVIDLQLAFFDALRTKLIVFLGVCAQIHILLHVASRSLLQFQPLEQCLDDRFIAADLEAFGVLNCVHVGAQNLYGVV